MSRTRCAWATAHPLLAEYHDHEWGRPSRDDRYLFEMLNLEGAQAGLSWLTILKKRAAYREAFANFEADRLLKFTPARRQRLLTNEGLIRHAGKIAAVFTNARSYAEVCGEHGTFANFIWDFSEATELSRALKQRGFKFVGPTICHAFLQAVGIINDHEPQCSWRRDDSEPAGISSGSNASRLPPSDR